MRYPRRTLALAATATLAAGLVLAGPAGVAGAQGAPADGGSPSGKIEPALRATLADGAPADFWVRFEDRADLAAAREIADWAERGAAVASALRETAAASQAAAVAELSEAGVRHRTFWATNAILVTGGSPELARRIAGYGDVEGVYAPRDYHLIEPVPAAEEPPDRLAEAVEWGIADIRADEVWDRFAVHGEGITVASIDTGVQFDHPALLAQYRGNLGGGELDHDYNWFNAAGTCPDRPCDQGGHGTHTMGTMVGDDGAENRIGVAPGATWIAANGCCPDDGGAALTASAQWMLEPTDLDGANPDASRRPHIVNNSWGSENPSNDPFLEDILKAWEASGILAVWSNGNSGPDCATSGSPGSRTINYSVGAYDRNHAIAGFSSRGPGQDGTIKPNLSAPGVQVRSSLPGDAYFALDGTSMAAPHVAGAVALLWSAVPALAGEVTATRELLDGTAIDTEDPRCGGTPEDNNVFGEGRLDAVALIEAAGETGTVRGTVTAADTGEPVADATVTITGVVTRTMTTGADGGYTVDLPTGGYTVTAAAFGYEDRSAEVVVEADQVARRDLPLAPVPRVTVTGQVRDGSGHGWPVYAEVRVRGETLATFTDPVTGRFELRLPAHDTHTLELGTRYPGYAGGAETVAVTDQDVDLDLTLTLDPERCGTAPGYRFGSDGLFETFDHPEAPAGWSVVDHLDNGQVWRFDDPRVRGNHTGGGGGFAIIDSDLYGREGQQHTSLVSPPVDLSAVADPVIRFQQDFRVFTGTEFANVELSLDGGDSWEPVLRQESRPAFGPRRDTVPIPQAAGEPDVRVRFRYGQASFDYWWQVDNVLIGSEVTCERVDGGLVVGVVRDDNTGGALAGATVTSDEDARRSATTVATRGDDALPDGLYWMFVPGDGPEPLTASAPRYTATGGTAGVVPDSVTRTDFRLGAGRLVVEPATVEAEVAPGGTATRTVTLTNIGTAPAEVALTTRGGPFEALAAGPAAVQRVPVAASLRELTGEVTGTTAAGPARAGAATGQWAGLPSFPHTVMDNSVAVVDGSVYSFSGVVGNNPSTEVFRFDPADQTWSALPDLPGTPRLQGIAGVIDGRVYLTGGWTAGPNPIPSSVAVFDPATESWSTAADAPVARTAAGTAVLHDQWYLVGGCTTGGCAPYADDVVRYDPDRDAWEQLAPYPVPTSWLSCAALDNELYCAGGVTADGPSTATYRYDPAAGSWHRLADMPYDLWGGATAGAAGELLIGGGITTGEVVTNQGLAYHPGTDTWRDLPPAGTAAVRAGSACGLYKVGGGVEFAPFAGWTVTDVVEQLPGYDDCGDPEPGWFTVDPAATTVAPGASVTVTVTLRADPGEAGTRNGSIRVRQDTPYPVAPVEVSRTATPPASWGLLTGTVTGTDCRGRGGDPLPLAGATVHITTWRSELTLTTDEDGGYAGWLDPWPGPALVVVTMPGHLPRIGVARVTAGEETVADWQLRRPCGPGGPHP